jgi:hypothetical protein
MLGRIPKAVWLALGVAFLIGFVSVVGWSSAQPTPHKSAQCETANCAVKISAPRSPDERIADYTLALAVLTAVLAALALFQGFMLVRADNTAQSMASTAAVQAQAAINSERPFVYVSDLELRPVILPTDAARIDFKLYKAVFTFTNYGRTPAFVKRIGWNQRITKDNLPPQPEYRFIDNLTVEVVISAGGKYELEIPNVMLSISPEQEKAIRLGTIRTWLWGNIRYRDFMNGEAETGFVAFHTPEIRVADVVAQTEGFRFQGPEAYTYQRYSEKGLT